MEFPSLKRLREDNVGYALDNLNIQLIYNWKFWIFIIVLIILLFRKKLKERTENRIKKKSDKNKDLKKRKEIQDEMRGRYVLEMNIINNDDGTEAKAFERQIKEKLLLLGEKYKKDIYILDKTKYKVNSEDINKKIILEGSISEKLSYDGENKIEGNFNTKIINKEYNDEIYISENNAGKEIKLFKNRMDSFIKDLFIRLCINNRDYDIGFKLGNDEIFSETEKNDIVIYINYFKLYDKDKKIEGEGFSYFEKLGKGPVAYYIFKSRKLFYEGNIKDAILINEYSKSKYPNDYSTYFNVAFLNIYNKNENKGLDEYIKITNKFGNNLNQLFIKAIWDFIEREQTLNYNQYLDLCKIYIGHYFDRECNYIPYIDTYMEFTKSKKIKKFLNNIKKELKYPKLK